MSTIGANIPLYRRYEHTALPTEARSEVSYFKVLVLKIDADQAGLPACVKVFTSSL
jgi:hypothetical protein